MDCLPFGPDRSFSNRSSPVLPIHACFPIMYLVVICKVSFIGIDREAFGYLVAHDVLFTFWCGWAVVNPLLLVFTHSLPVPGLLHFPPRTYWYHVK
jgi:hypothetical protein